MENKYLTLSAFFKMGRFWKICKDKTSILILLLCLFVLKVPFKTNAQTTTQYSLGVPVKNPINEAENLIASIDFNKLKKEVAAATGMSSSDASLFFQYIERRLERDRLVLLQKALKGIITVADLPQITDQLKQSYIALYPTFLLEKTDFALKLAASDNQPLAANGPCTNMGFEDGTFTGWQGDYGDHSVSGNQAVQSGTKTGFGEHCVMSSGMKDPYAPINVIPPGMTHSVRVGNVVAGGQSARIRQTFMVTNSNVLFTYMYAVVLEDPDKDHTDPQRPYFMAKLMDQNGNEITCANYKVIVNPSISGFKEICSNSTVEMDTNNMGCPNGAPGYDGNGVYNGGTISNPPCNTTSGRNGHDIYYKDWTSVSIILDNYVGQNVTIEFTAADCSKGGHFGYAYVAAKCNAFSVPTGMPICSGREQKTLTAPPGFQTYVWSTATTSGHIVSTPTTVTSGKQNYNIDNTSGTYNTTGPSVTVDKAGTYMLTITPFSDITGPACARSYPIVLTENCPPREITIPLCESTQGSGTATGVNLTTYNSQAIAGITGATVSSWVNASTKGVINPATNVTVSNGQKLWAMLTYPNGSDTTVFTFVINPLPVITLKPVNPVCLNSPAFAVTATPASGTFSVSPAGSTINASTGVFSPTATGTFTVSYQVTDVNGCKNTNTIPVVVVAPPTVNAGPDQNLCENAKTASLSGTFTNAAGVTWSGGAGTFSPATGTTSPVPSTYTLATADKSGSLTLTLTTNMGTSPCPAVTDQVVLNFEKIKTANAGPDQAYCSNVSSVNLAGSVVNTSTYTWSVLTGTAASLTNTSTLTPVYKPVTADFTRGYVAITLKPTGNVLCPAAPDTMKITFGALPTINAGPDQTLCENKVPVKLAATYTNAGGVQWSGPTPSTGGSFSSSGTDAQGTYTPTATDINNGSVTLTVITTNTGLCPPVSDQVTINFEKLITADAGPDQNLCASATSVALKATVQNAKTMLWSAGSTGGTFSPATSAVTTYTPSAADLAAGVATITITPAGQVVCPGTKDDLKVFFEPVPKINAGPDQALCENTPAVQLAGGVINAPGAIWSGGSSAGFSSNTDPKAVYTATAADINSGVTLTLTSTGTLYCPAVSDQMTVTFEKLPAADAGPDQSFCETVASIPLNASTTNAPSYVWSSGSGVTTLPSGLTGGYAPSDAEKSLGTITLTLTTKGNVYCPAATDDITFNFEKVPTSDAGPDQTFCANKNIEVQLGGHVTHATGGKWSGGLGTYSLSPNDSNATYFPTSGEITSGLVTLTYTSQGNQLCPAASDQVNIHIDLPPTADAGPDQIVCANNPSVTLAGKITIATSALWSNGNGSYSPDNSLVTAGYTPSGSEISGEKSKLILTTAGNGTCPPAVDTMEITIIPIPVVDPGTDKAGCEGTPFTLSVQQLPDVTYEWKKADGTVLGNDISIQVTTVPGDVMYYITTTTLVNACTYSDSVKVIGTPLPVVAVADTGVCAGLPASLTARIVNQANVGPAQIDYEWYKGNTLLDYKVPVIPANEPGIYSVKVSIGGRCTDTDSAEVFSYPYPQPVLPQGSRFCVDSDKHLILDAGPGAKYLWMPTGDTTRTLSVTTGGIFQVIVTSKYNCSGTASAEVCESCPPQVYVSNAFTPNEDGTNEFYNVYGTHIVKFHMLIFNRWGEIIFESKDKNNAWDGYYRGEPMPIGVYPWIITYEGGCGNEGPYKMEGSVTVVR